MKDKMRVIEIMEKCVDLSKEKEYILSPFSKDDDESDDGGSDDKENEK